jgi:hypothetical protein
MLLLPSPSRSRSVCDLLETSEIVRAPRQPPRRKPSGLITPPAHFALPIVMSSIQNIAVTVCSLCDKGGSRFPPSGHVGVRLELNNPIRYPGRR